MLPSFPGVYISCPCSDQNTARPSDTTDKRPKKPSVSDTSDPDFDPYDEPEDEPFDPHNPRSAFSLFPIDHLLYCGDCHQIRCPRCVSEEIVSYFCPSCLFEAPSSTVKTEGNRCTRGACFQCPICFASLSVTSTGESGATTTSLAPSGEQVQVPAGPYTLTCTYCHWTSREIGLEFEKPANLVAQLAKMLKSAVDLNPKPEYAEYGTHEQQFSNLRAHYSSLGIGVAGSTGTGLGGIRGGTDDYGNSPSTLSRLMGLHTGGGHVGKRNISGLSARGLSGRDPSSRKTEFTEMEDLEIVSDEREIIDRLLQADFNETTTRTQSLCHPHHPRFKSQLRPIATLLRTKRSKRCRACRHILVRPEAKVQSIRFRIKLVAVNYIPSISINRIDTSFNYHSLTPLSTHQYLLTVTNPLFEPICVSLSTPRKTPGKYPCVVTILCPEFDVGANTDDWEEVLREDRDDDKSKSSRGGRGRDRQSSMASGGTVWNSGRNWTTVIIEVIPPNVEGRIGNAARLGPGGPGFITPGPTGRAGTPPPRVGSPLPLPWALSRSPSTPGPLGAASGSWAEGSLGSEADDDGDERDDEDEKIVQVPVFVRVEYEAEVGMEGGDVGDVAGGEGKKEKREHAYWCVLFLGKIGSTMPASGAGTGGGIGSIPGTPGGGMGVAGVGLRDAGVLGVGVGMGVGGGGVAGVMGRMVGSSSKGLAPGNRER